jgi:hypothetical protein
MLATSIFVFASAQSVKKSAADGSAPVDDDLVPHGLAVEDAVVDDGDVHAGARKHLEDAARGVQARHAGRDVEQHKHGVE